jgi:hypothetical protein
MLALSSPYLYGRNSVATKDTSTSATSTESGHASGKTAQIKRARMWRGFRLRWVKPRHVGCIEIDSTPLFTWVRDTKYTYEDDYECS